MTAPCISVVIPVYNAARYVRRAVTSALAQQEVAEVLLVEDGSTDNSAAECEALAQAESRVRLLRHPRGGNHGAAAARNVGIGHAMHPLLAFLDADDYYLPGRFQTTLQRFADVAVDGVYEAIGVAYESDESRDRFLAAHGGTLNAEGLTTIPRGIAAADLCRELLRGRAGFCSLDGLTVRRELVARTGGFHEALRLHQDSHFLIRTAYHGRLVAGVLDRGVTIRWVHAGNRITQATRDVSLPYRRVLWRSLTDWALREQVRPDVFSAVLWRYFVDTSNSHRGFKSRVHWLARELQAEPWLTLRWLVRRARLRRSGVKSGAS